MGVRIEEYQEKHAQRISEIIVKNLLEVNIADYPIEEMEAMAKEFTKRDILKIMKDRHVFVAIEGNRVIATGGICNSFCDNKEEFWVLTVFVEPSYHGQGIGRKIMRCLEEKTKALGGKRMVIPSSLTSHRFYLALGYTYIGGKALINSKKQYMLEKFLE